MFVAIDSYSSTYSGELDAKVISGASICRPGNRYFMMRSGRCIGVGRITQVSQDVDKTMIRFILSSDIDRHVIQFAEKMFRIQIADSNGDGRPVPESYADSAGTRHRTSTMDAATTIMTGRDVDVDRLAGGHRRSYGIADMMGGLDDDDL